jgi:hydrogenase/urease accessory protein HupE
MAGGWLAAPPQISRAPVYLIQSWTVPATAAPLASQRIEISGLDHSITDTLVRLTAVDGTVTTRVLTPDHPSFVIGAPVEEPAATAYFALGIRHILTGPDHLLFVCGLLLIAGGGRRILATVSAFTVAHSITLAAAALGLVALPVALVEALIALSILFVAVEAVNARAGHPGWGSSNPWAVAFAFGLLHGFGFASGLTALGLPRGEIPLALLSFNVGVEIGQLGFVAMILLLLRAFKIMEMRWPLWLERAPGYVVGSLGAFWTIQCVVTMVSGG